MAGETKPKLRCENVATSGYEIELNEDTGKWFIIGPDGYSTSRREWAHKWQAEKALRRECIAEQAGKSYLAWDY